MLTLTSPHKTPLHRVSAGPKLAVLLVVTAGLMAVQNPWLIGTAAAVMVAVYCSFGAGFARFGLGMLRPLWPFVLIVLLWQGWHGEWLAGAILAARMLVAVALANLVTMTTRLADMMDVVEKITHPLKRLGLRPQVLALAVALVVRFTPVLMDKAGQLLQAWRARSLRRANWRVVLPMSLIALDEAEHVAEAIRARGGL